MTIRIFVLKKIPILAYFIILIFNFSCVEKYPVEIVEEYDQSLVVDGKITNEPGPYTILLSRSTSIEKPEPNPVTGAMVQIVDNAGNSETLTEIGPGIYKTAVSGIQGTIGRSYKLIIRTENGENYESEFDELLAPVGIESLTYKQETRFSPDFNVDYEDGFQFYISTTTSDRNKSYYYLELEETYEIRSTWIISFIYRGDGWTVQNLYKSPTYADTLFYCWRTIKNNSFIYNTELLSTPKINNLPINFFIYNTELLSTPKINNLPINFVSFNDEKLQYKYSLLVHQFAVSEETHAYFKALLDQDAGQEGLYTKQPYQIQGNVYNKENLDEPVLGYFMVASTVEGSRLTVPRPRIRINRPWECELGNFISPKGFSAINIEFRNHPELWPIYVYEYIDDSGEFTQVVPPQECIDCTKRGGILKKPDYWDQ